MIYFTYKQDQHLLAHFLEHLLTVALSKANFSIGKSSTGAGYSFITTTETKLDLGHLIGLISEEDFHQHKKLVISEESSRILYRNHIFSKIVSDNYSSLNSFWHKIEELEQLNFSQLIQLPALFQLQEINNQQEIEQISAYNDHFTPPVITSESASPKPLVRELLYYIPCDGYSEALLISSYYHLLVKALRQHNYRQGISYQLSSLLSKPASKGLLISFSFITQFPEITLPLIAPVEFTDLKSNFLEEIERKDQSFTSLFQQKIEWGTSYDQETLLNSFAIENINSIISKILAKAEVYAVNFG